MKKFKKRDKNVIKSSIVYQCIIMKVFAYCITTVSDSCIIIHHVTLPNVPICFLKCGKRCKISSE